MKRFLIGTTLAVIATIGLTGTAFAQEFSFRFQSSDPAGNPNFEYQKGWTDLVAERSGGKVKIELLPVGSVVDASMSPRSSLTTKVLPSRIRTRVAGMIPSLDACRRCAPRSPSACPSAAGTGARTAG